MGHVVMCWELGGDLGHVARLRPLAEALRLRGHRVSFILRETVAAERLLDPGPYAWLQAPLQAVPVSPACIPTRHLPHILHNVGFHDEQALLGRMRAWRSLYAALKPDLLVFDHSPTALLAARGLPVKRIVLGTGFGVPPQAIPLPAFDAADPPASTDAVERQILDRANAALRVFGQAPLARFVDLYEADASLLFTLRELDHYPERADGDYWGPPLQDGGETPIWPAATGKRVFAYLKPFKTLPALLETLKQAGLPTLVYASQGQLPPETPPHIRHTAKPVDLTRVTQESDLVICHAGHGTVSAALLAGKPLLLLPLNIEQRMLATRVHTAGMGLSAPALMPEGMRQKLSRLLEEASFTSTARTFAERYAALAVEKNPERFAALAEKLLGS